MAKSLALFMTIVVAGTFAITTAAGAQARHFGPRVYYPLPPPSAPGWRETPMYAPDAPPPRYWNNPGLPDFQLGARN